MTTTVNDQLVRQLDEAHEAARAAFSAAWQAVVDATGLRDSNKWDRSREDVQHALALAADARKAEGALFRARRGLVAVPLKPGQVHCERCGGLGGSHSWPGYTCYGCDGRGAVDA